MLSGKPRKLELCNIIFASLETEYGVLIIVIVLDVTD